MEAWLLLQGEPQSASSLPKEEHLQTVFVSLDGSVFLPLQVVTFSGAIGLQSNSACLLGHLHLAHMSTSHSHTAGRNSSFFFFFWTNSL